MSIDFLRCVKNKGRVRTKRLSKGRYIRICFLNGKSYESEVATRKDYKKVNRKKK